MTQRKVQQQLVWRSKSQAAFVADVRPRLQVDVLVLVQSLRLRELAPAIFTLKRLLACVMAHVRSVLRRQQERLLAQAARIRAVVGVDALVGVEVVDAREALAACITSVRAFASVSTNMQVQVADLSKLAVTCIAGVRTVARVGSHVALEVAWPEEGSLALATFVRWQQTLVVSSEVDTEVARGSECDAAHVAAVTFLSSSPTALRCRLFYFLRCLYGCRIHLRHHCRIHLLHHFRTFGCFNLHFCIHHVIILHNFICNSFALLK